MNPTSWQTVFTWLLYAGIVFTAFGTIGSKYFGKKGKQQKEKAANVKMDSLLKGNENLQKQLEPFLQFATQKYPDVEEAAALEKLKHDLEEIKSKMMPRTLNQEKRKRLVEKLRQEEKKKFTISAIMGDQEAFELAQSLKEDIEEAGNDVGLSANTPFRGLLISVGTEVVPGCVDAIGKILRGVGFKVTDIYEANQDPNTVNIIIGSKP